LIRGQVIKGLVRPDVVVDVFPLGQLLIMLLQVQVHIVDLVKLLSVGPVGPLDMPVELGRLGRKDIQRDLLGLTFLLELVLELRATIDLDGSDRIRELLSQIVEEVSRLEAGLVFIGPDGVVPAHHIPG
jgi:hypothetical protein